MNRLDRVDYFMNMANLVSMRSTCPRASVGCVITLDNKVMATGYNGAPSGTEHCGCEMVDNHCKRAIHAEANAVINLNNIQQKSGSIWTIYSTHEPCWECTKLLYTKGIKHIWFKEYYLSNQYLGLRDKIFKDLKVSTWLLDYLIK